MVLLFHWVLLYVHDYLIFLRDYVTAIIALLTELMDCVIAITVFLRDCYIHPWQYQLTPIPLYEIYHTMINSGRPIKSIVGKEHGANWPQWYSKPHIKLTGQKDQPTAWTPRPTLQHENTITYKCTLPSMNITIPNKPWVYSGVYIVHWLGMQVR